MPTPPQPVPWDEVIDIQGDLFEWLADRGHGKPAESPIAVALRMLGAYPDDERPERRVARALFDLGRFHGHARDEDAPDSRPEQEADRSLRGLQPTMRHIQRLVRTSQEPAVERMDQSDFLPEVKENSEVQLAAEYDAWNERLEAHDRSPRRAPRTVPHSLPIRVPTTPDAFRLADAKEGAESELGGSRYQVELLVAGMHLQCIITSILPPRRSRPALVITRL